MHPVTPNSSVSDSSVDSEINQKVRHPCGVFLPKLFRGIRIEPVFLFFAIGDSIVQIQVQTYYIDRICRITKGYEPQICQNLTHYPAIETELEKDASELSMFQILIESGFPIILALFLGPLTEKYGYKPLMLYSLSGYILYIISMMVTCFLPFLPPQYFLISSLALAMSGGVVTLMISSYGYMVTQTNDSNRSYRLGILSGVWDLATVIGYVCGSSIFHRGSFPLTFLYTLVFYSLAFFYTMIFIRERKSEVTELIGSSQSSSVIIDACSLQPIKEVFHSALKSRPGDRRKTILIIVAATCFGYLAYASKNIQYLFTRNQFGWNAERYSEFSAINTFLSGSGSAILTIFFMKFLKFQDVNILTFTTISNLSAYLLFASAKQEFTFILGGATMMFGSISSAVFKSMLAKYVHKEEYGKILSFVICVELSMPFISGPLYNFVFIHTNSVLPGAIFLVAGGFIFVVLILVGVLHILTRKIEDYSLVVNDND